MEDRDPTLLPGQRPRGRGALSNAVGRFEPLSREGVDDGWDIPEEPRVVRTEVRTEVPRTALTWNRSPDLPFDRSVNPYRGCEHGCIYCYARPTHAFLNLSPGLDFETRLIARPGIAEVLARELRRPGYAPASIALGTNTDPYQPIDAELGLTRQLLAVMRDFRHPVHVTTRGTGILRDLDILADLAAEGLAAVAVSVTTLDAGLARRMEPRAPAPARRLQVVADLARAGVPVMVNFSPVIPALTDHELESVAEAAARAGAWRFSSLPLRLPQEVAGLFRAWAEATVPDRAARILGRVRAMHGGRDYDPAFGTRMTGQGVWAELHARRKAVVRARLGLDRPHPALRCDLFRAPPRPGDQLPLF